MERKLGHVLSPITAIFIKFYCLWHMRLLRDSEGCAVGPKFSIGLNEMKRDLFLALAILPERMVFYSGKKTTSGSSDSTSPFWVPNHVPLGTTSWPLGLFAQQKYINPVCLLIPNMGNHPFHTHYLFYVAGWWWERGQRHFQSSHLSSRKEKDVNSFAPLGRFALGSSPEQLKKLGEEQ